MIVTWPTLGITTPVSVLVKTDVTTSVAVETSATVVVTPETIVVGFTPVPMPVEIGTAPSDPSDDQNDMTVVGATSVTSVTNVVVNVEALLNEDVRVLVNVEVKRIVVTGTVTFRVK